MLCTLCGLVKSRIFVSGWSCFDGGSFVFVCAQCEAKRCPYGSAGTVFGVLDRGQGLACLQLSRLQQDWENTTWLCFFFGYLFFMAGYDLLEQRFADGNGANGKGKQQQLPHAEKRTGSGIREKAGAF